MQIAFNTTSSAFRLVIRIAAIAVAMIGLAVVIGWIFDISALKNIQNGAPTMKFSTSISFVCTGIVTYFVAQLLLPTKNRWSDICEIILPAALLLLILLMSVHIASAILAKPSGIDNLFVSESTHTPYTAIPGRPSIATIASFVLVAIAGTAALRRHSSLKKLLHVVGVSIMCIGGIALIGYSTSIPMLYYSLENISNGMAIHTAALFVTIGLILVAISKGAKEESKRGTIDPSEQGVSVRTKFAGVLLTVSIIPVLFVGAVATNNASSLPAELFVGSLAVLGIATAISVTFFALSLSHSLLRPLLSLKSAIKEVADGKYETEIPCESGDEIGSLAKDVEQMKNTIVETNRNLERLVNARTAELQSSKKQLEIVVAQLREQERLMKEFIDVAAHELKNPITPILVTTQILAKREIDNKITITKNEFNLIAQNAVRLKRLCEDILDVARIEHSGLKLEKTHFDLAELLQQTIEESSPITKSGVELSFEGSEMNIDGDRGKIQEVILNLVHNAIKFTSEGAIRVTLTMNSDSEAVVTVKDTGNGIDPEILPRLFSKYVSKSTKGTGLGLFISKAIVEAHRGKMWAQNNANGKGATFAFSLPASPDAAPQNRAGTNAYPSFMSPSSR